MAPNRRLEEKLRKLGLSSDDHGAGSSSPAVRFKHVFRIYFPMPPYDGLQFQAVRSGPGFNFTGQLLGVGGKQLQRIKQESSARVEVVNAQGNLNGAHPDPLDPDLHAVITADSLAKLQKATDMVCELLQPVNASFAPVKATPGGNVRLAVARAKQANNVNSVDGRGVQVAQSTVSNAPVMSRAAAEAVRSPTVSPLLTPVTPAATACHNGPFTACVTVHSTTPRPPCGRRQHEADDPATENAHFTGSHSDQSSSAVVLSNIRAEDLKVAAHVVHSSPPLAYANAGNSSDTTGCMAAGSCQATPVAAAALPVAQASYLCQPPGFQQVEAAAHAGDLQPSTPTARPGTQSGDGNAVQQHCECCGLRVCCCEHLPSPQLQASGMAAIKPRSQVIQNTGIRPSVDSCASKLQGEAPPAAHLPEQKPACCAVNLGHCFQYGLGLYPSSSWDSPLSCSSRESPALRALLADHERQQQEEQMQRMQACTGLGMQFAVSNTPTQQSSFPMGNLPVDDFSLGPAALPWLAAVAAQAKGNFPWADTQQIAQLPAGFIDSTSVGAVHIDPCTDGQSLYCKQEAAKVDAMLRCWHESHTGTNSSQIFGRDHPHGISPAAPPALSSMDVEGPYSSHCGAGIQAGMIHTAHCTHAATPTLLGTPGHNMTACSMHEEAQHEQCTMGQQRQCAFYPRSGQYGMFGSLHAVSGSIW